MGQHNADITGGNLSYSYTQRQKHSRFRGSVGESNLNINEGEYAMFLCCISLGNVGRGGPGLRKPPDGFQSVSQGSRGAEDIYCTFREDQVSKCMYCALFLFSRFRTRPDVYCSMLKLVLKRMLVYRHILCILFAIGRRTVE